MRSRFVSVLGALGALFLASSSAAVSLAITPDKAVYNLGETITISLLGDPSGGSGSSISGDVLFDSSLVSPTNISLSLDPLFGGSLASCGTSSCVWLNHSVTDTSTLITGTLTMTADAAGVVSVDWDTNLDFFGLTTAPSAVFTIVPEPGTALLTLCGLTGLALRRRG